MGYLLKEALKTLCGINQWSYAVFWKIGLQHPKLLIWEESYKIPCSALPRISGIDNSELALEEWEACWNSSESHNPLLRVQEEDKVHLLINKMMMENQIKIVGEGLVGRAAFTGQHLWILLENFAREIYQPPEVLSEVDHQFSAGIKTVAVIPVPPCGVVQLGSSLAIVENMAFVNDVKTLILQLGCIPSALLSESSMSKDPAPKVGVPVCLTSIDPFGNCKVENSVASVADGCMQSISSKVTRTVSQPSDLLTRQMKGNLPGISPAFQASKAMENVFKLHEDLIQQKHNPIIKSTVPLDTQFENGIARAEVILSNPDIWLNDRTSLYDLTSGFDEQPCVGLLPTNCDNPDTVLREHAKHSLSTMNDGFRLSQLRKNIGLSSSGSQLVTDANNQDRSVLNPYSFSNEHGLAEVVIPSDQVLGSKPHAGSSKIKVSDCDATDHMASNSGSYDLRHHSVNAKYSKGVMAQGKERTENDLFQASKIPIVQLYEHTNFGDQIPGFPHDDQKHDSRNPSMGHANVRNEDECIRPPSGDDLFDILGFDFKKKVLKDGWNSICSDGMGMTMEDLHGSGSDIYLGDEGNSVSGIFSVNSADNLLDAVVNKVQTAAKQSSDDSLSCRTTLTKISGTSIPISSSLHSQSVVPDQMQGGLFILPKSLEKLGVAGSCSFKSDCTKEEVGHCSQTSSLYGSQISSWIGQGHSMKPSNGASTVYSERPEVCKTNRKRLKLGENPRPRPKDRQMIQDRMKELREIVPNGAKCSIDALLERTVKHMLFLQSVTKHADKLKQTGESKIISKDGGLLSKDNFGGGRTWAYEVGSQSMVCPIIVEDLNAPRQMLVEMLCEERGLFLEIADIIRGMGLMILKGVMETRNDKIWAHFAVEANRDITRMEIFLSLVHLLEPTAKKSATSGNCVENDDVMVHQPFHHPPSIPAMGRPL